MELRQLEYFQMVSKLNSFTRAAEQLYVSQPAVTNTIRGLEEELGIQLFDRSQKQVLLTAEGKIFYNHVENVLRGVSKTLADINNIKSLNGGLLRIALTPMAGVRPFAALLTAFRQKYPDIQLFFDERNNEDGQKALFEDRADLALLMPEEQQHPSLAYMIIGKQELVVCLQAEHPLAGERSIGLADLEKENFILFRQECALRKLILQAFEELDTLPRIQFESSHIQTIKALVAENAGVAILPKDCCAVERRLEILPLTEPLYIELAIGYKKQKTLSHAAEAFLHMAESMYIKRRM